MRRILPVLIFLGLGYLAVEQFGAGGGSGSASVESSAVESSTVESSAPDSSAVETRSASADSVIAEAFEARRSDVQVAGSGKVTRLLADDNNGSRHQRFILRLGSGHTLLIAHNIDLAPRIAGLKEGDVVEFNGEYEWNEQGGVIHWTHKDPRGQHEAGWLRHLGRIYQ